MFIFCCPGASKGDKRISFLPGLEALEVAFDRGGLELSILLFCIEPSDLPKADTVKNVGVLDWARRDLRVFPTEIPQSDGVSVRALSSCFQALGLLLSFLQSINSKIQES